MALKLIEGFDHVSSGPKASAKGWTEAFASGGNMTSTITTGRINGSCYRITSGTFATANLTTFKKNLPSALSTLIVGYAFRCNLLPAISSMRTFSLYASSGATETVRVQLTSSGKIQVLTSGGTVIATGTTTLATNTWYYIEVKVVIAGASGSVTVNLNGAAEIATTTGNFGSTNIDAIGAARQDSSNNVSTDYDDIYVADTTGSAPNNTFLGDVHVETLVPTADGAHTDFTPSTGTAHWSLVDEVSGTAPNDDTDYVSSSTVGHRDSYTFSDLAILAGSIFGVQTVQDARKDDAGTRQIAAVTRSGGTDFDGATVTLGSGYSIGTEIRETDPATGAAWTISGVNAAEFGVKVVA